MSHIEPHARAKMSLSEEPKAMSHIEPSAWAKMSQSEEPKAKSLKRAKSKASPQSFYQDYIEY